MRKTIGILLLVSYYAAYNQESSHIIDFETNYMSDIISNFSGGLDSASTYLELIDLFANLNTEDAGLRNSREFFLQILNTHGGTPTENFVGDMQAFSNIENGDFTMLYQFWYRHSINKFSILVGVHDLNSEFLASDLASEYINSSFGFMPVASWNVPVSIFPKNSVGAIIRFNQSENLSFLAGFYDGDPLSLDEDPYNTDFTINSDEGIFSIIKVNYQSEKFGGSYKIGGFHHNGDFDDFNDSLNSVSGNFRVYLIGDQSVYSFNENGNASIFLELGISPKNSSLNSLFWSLGVNLSGFLSKRPINILGFAIANATISGDFVKSNLQEIDKNYETAFEFMYKLSVSDNITFQPEIQYIINPVANSKIVNVLVG